MGQDVFELVQEMDLKDIQTQLALQCAPLIAGLKISNLLITQNSNVWKVKQVLGNTAISCSVLLSTEKKTTLLLYREEELKASLRQPEVRTFLEGMGYGDKDFPEMISAFRLRYRSYIWGEREFPHEMGVFLGYPIEDVEGFIRHSGKNYLYAGYWKVYADMPAKIQLFHKFEYAKETLIRLLSKGISMVEIIDFYHHNKLLQTAI